MKSKFYLFAGLGLMALTAGAQKLTTEYITWPSSPGLPGYVNQWTPGEELIEDENFFISRVKIKPYIDRNSLTQVFEEITDNNDKKSMVFIPVGDASRDGVHTNALPNSLFDSEVFSMWSYLTHYSDWTSPYGWVPGGFADAAHKHGTAVSGVASVPNLPITGDWFTCMTNMSRLDAEKAAKFFIYHGVDGLGYNSEWSNGSSFQKGLSDFHGAVMKIMAEKNPKFENFWYTGTEDNGSINNFYDGLYSRNSYLFGDKDNPRTSLFLNYNWKETDKINESISTANSLGRDMRDIYAGMNMQGGCKYNGEWETLRNVNYSLGMWGAHNHNYFWAPRSQTGSSDESKQTTYQQLLEYWYTNGKRNPVIKLPFRQDKNLGVSNTFHGLSRYVAERSSLGWDLAEEPFISYFNLGNGKFFNWMGERQNDIAWYVIGIQDYMPTWRWWFSTEFLGKEESTVPSKGLEAAFTWDDAYFGGSCVRVSGSIAKEYLHLFKTNFLIKNDDVITVRYKLISGKSDITLALSDSKTPLAEEELKVISAEECVADDEVWVEKTFVVQRKLASAIRNRSIAVIGLKFENADNLDLLLGEISIKRGTYAAPAAPEITKVKALAYNHAGADAKVIFKMPNNKAAGEPCYNSDVNTSLFRIWFQQQDGEPVNMGATTSWAAIVYQGPMDSNKPAKMRVGVQAIGFDYQAASEITWSDYVDCGDYVTVDDIQANKNTICTGEEFELSFVDPKHPAANWTVYDKAGTEVKSANGTSIKLSIDKVGNYDVKVDDKMYADFFTITDWERGALPEIQSLAINGAENEDVSITIDEEFELSYTGRRANGQASQALLSNDKFIGFPCDNTSLAGNRTGFAFAAWVKLTDMPTNARLWGIEDRAGKDWPTNHWGVVWSNFNDDGTFNVTFRSGGWGQGAAETQYVFTNYKVAQNQWTHLAFSVEYNNENKFRMIAYMNGEIMIPTTIKVKGNELGVDYSNPNNYWVATSVTISKTDHLYLIGGAGDPQVYTNGAVDDLVLYSTPITTEEVKMAYNGLNTKELPRNVECLWTFEDQPNEKYEFLSVGSNPGRPAYNYGLIVPEDATEGKAIPTAVFPEFTSGSPYLPGEFKIETKPTWKVRNAKITEQGGNDLSGAAKMSITTPGDYTATLKLENTLGQHTRTYPMLTVGKKTAIDNVDANAELDVYTTDDAVIIAVTEDGNYTVSVFDIAGKLVAQRNAQMTAGNTATIALRNAGVYLVNIACDGKVVRTAKIVKK